MEPDYKDLAFKGRMILSDMRAAEDAEHARRALTAAQVTRASMPPQPPAHVVAARPAPTAPASQLESFNVFDPRDGRTIGAVKVIGNRFVAHDVTGQVVAKCRTAHEAMRAVEQSATDAMWASIISEAGHGRHARPPAAPEDNHGWPAAIAKAQAEQSNSVSSTSQADVDAMWSEVIADANEARNGKARPTASGRQSENHGWSEIFKRVSNGA